MKSIELNSNDSVRQQAMPIKHTIRSAALAEWPGTSLGSMTGRNGLSQFAVTV
jgi:hypothetical protein